MKAFKQFSLVLFLSVFAFGLLFDILNREIPQDWLERTVSIEEAQQAITDTFASTFAVDEALSARR